MFIYSAPILQFIQEIKSIMKEILVNEMGLKVFGMRFYDKSQRYSYPIKVVVYNNKTCLGYFDADFYELGFHERLMINKRELHNVIRHELAHYMTFITYGEVQAHGKEFRDFCKQMGWGDEVYSATTELTAITSENNPILRKVQKLMALSTSSNPHEAELALIKSQQLLLSHNISYVEESEKIFLKRIMKQKKETAKMRAIAKILETFFVNIVYNRSSEFTYLEISGSAVNLEIAEYVADFLTLEFDNLWDSARKESFLKGMIAKNSFFMGISKGYCNKIHAFKKEYSGSTRHALMVIEKKLMEGKSIIYPRLSFASRKGNHCSHASQLGEQMGRQLSINPAIKNNTKSIWGILSLK